METLVVPQGEFSLVRYPTRPHETLRAWDAADELLLEHVAGALIPSDTAVMIVNDAFGALAVALTPRRPIVQSDSYLALAGARANLSRLGLDPSAVTFLSSVEHPIAPVHLLVIKVPRSLALLEHQLASLAPALAPDAVVIGAGMTKHIHASTLETFDRLIGPTTTSLAKKKARLVFSSLRAADPDSAPAPASPRLTPAPAPATTSTYRLAGAAQPVTVVSLPGVFGGGRLDRGTELLLAHLPNELESSRDIESIVDLGCGDGIVGVVAALMHPPAEVTFVDESFLAVASAEATYHATLGGEGAGSRARFVVGNGLFDLESGAPIERESVDLVLNNPPFHTNNALSDAVAWSMFADARDALAPGGELWVVGNRHLAYHAKLKRLFGACDVIASNPKFVLLRAVKR